MKISIVGGGNIGTLMAAEFSFRGYNVIVYTSNPGRWNSNIKVVDNDGNLYLEGRIDCVTNDIATVADSDYIFVTLPSVAQNDFVQKLLPFAKKGTRIGVIPGYGGAEFIFKPLIDVGCILFGFQRVHSIARLIEYGNVVCMKGRKDSIYLGAVCTGKTRELCCDMQEMFDMPCIALPSYLCVTLTPSNPILHTSRLYGMFNSNKINHIYDKNFLFYEEWTNGDSKIMLAADEELQNICRMLNRMDLSSVRSLKDHYESYTKEAMTQKIRSISAFKGIGSPMLKTDNGWIADLSSRYFTCDFAYGLEILCQFGRVTGVNTPNMDMMLDWYKTVSSNNGSPIDIYSCGISSVDDVYKFYNV